MSYEPIVYCRECGEPLDVYQPYEERFCCEECEQAYYDNLIWESSKGVPE